MNMRSLSTRSILASLLALCLLVVACGGEGGSSPEDVFGKAKTAMNDKDWSGVMECVQPDDRPMMAMSVYLAGTMMSSMGGLLGGNEKAGAMKSDFEDICKKHGLDSSPSALKNMKSGDQEQMRTAAAEMMKDVDHAAFFEDMMGWMETHGGDKGNDWSSKVQGELTDLKVDGDTATGKAGSNKMNFVRVDGSWYLKLL